MWALKVIIPTNEGMLVGSNAKKYNVSIMGYPINYFWKKKRFYLFGSIYLIGNSKAKTAFLKAMKNDKRTINIEMTNENFGFWLIEQHPATEIFCAPLLIHPKPMIVSNNGDYIFELASWDRNLLENIAKKTESKLFNGKLIYFKKSKIDNIQIISILPNLTSKQKQALELAIEHKYYGYPRGIEIDKMAKMMKVSYSTFQFHLRNAEKKIIPYLTNVST